MTEKFERTKGPKKYVRAEIDKGLKIRKKLTKVEKWIKIDKKATNWPEANTTASRL